MEQIAIALTGVVAIWLSQDGRPEYRRYACVFGLIGQPFWFYSAYMAEQWGIFVLCIFYTWAWFKGFRLYWMKPAFVIKTEFIGDSEYFMIYRRTVLGDLFFERWNTQESAITRLNEL